jgi:hypothetical protein
MLQLPDEYPVTVTMQAKGYATKAAKLTSQTRKGQMPDKAELNPMANTLTDEQLENLCECWLSASCNSITSGGLGGNQTRADFLMCLATFSRYDEHGAVLLSDLLLVPFKHIVPGKVVLGLGLLSEHSKTNTIGQIHWKAAD